VHFFDPHMSYDAPPPFRGRFTSAVPAQRQLPVANWRRIRAEAPDLSDPERRFISAAYDEEVAFVDSEIGRLLGELEQRRVLERGLVVLTSDHGEELFEHGGFEHGHAMWEELLWVPLVFWGREVQAGHEETPVSLVDVAPTILEAVGVPRPDATEGVSLWPNLERGEALPSRTLYAEQPLYGVLRRAALQWPFKLEYEQRSRRRRLFDLESDPREARRVESDHRQLAVRLQKSTREHFATLDATRSSRIVLPERDLESRLRELGYLE
jgi:arylsulfatase A-like enzyme